MQEINFKTLDKLILELQDGISKVKDGNLPRKEFNNLLAAARLLHERLAILQYLSEKPPLTTTKDIAIDESEPIVEKNQINLLDAIVEEEVKTDTSIIASDKINQSINELHSQTPQTSLADQFGQQPINDLTKEIGLNEKFLLTENLFNGSSPDYNEAINNLNNFENTDQALKYFKGELVKKYDWNIKKTQVKRFIKLVERRYNT
mgnify:CR=1 FL=1